MKRPRGFFDNIFPEFSDIEREFDRLFEHAAQAGGQGPVFYGYEMSMGPDGVPHVKTYGNLPEMSDAEDLTLDEGVREPFTDVMVDGDHVIVTAEMPGIEKKDIKLNATETSLELSAETETRKYHKTVSLAREIVPETAKAHYNNGVVEIQADIKEPDNDTGVDIEVE